MAVLDRVGIGMVRLGEWCWVRLGVGRLWGLIFGWGERIGIRRWCVVM